MSNLTVNRKEIIKSITNHKPVVKNNNKLPILSNILISINNDKIQFTGTNLDFHIITSVQAIENNNIKGNFLINCKDVLDILKSLSTDIIEIETTENSFIIENISLPLQDIEQFPYITQEEIIYTMSDISQEIKDKSLIACKFVATDNTRITLTGVYFEVSEIETIITGTNGHILTTNNIVENNCFSHNFILQTLPILQTMKTKKEKININICESQAIIEIGNNYKIISKLIYGPYPDYKQVIPTDYKIKVEIDKNILSIANKSLLPCAYEMTNQITFDYYQNKLYLSAFDPYTNKSGKQEIDSKITTGGNIKTSYNGKFIDLILSHIKSDLINIELTSETSASVICEKDSKDSLFLIMPLRLND